MGVRANQRLPRALAGRLAVALMAVVATTTLSAQTVMQPRLVVRALTNGDIASYKLPSTTQVSGGLNTVAIGEPLYLEVQVDSSIPASQMGGTIWTLTTKPSGSTATLATSPLGSNVPIAEPSDRLVYQVAGRQLLRPDVHGVYVVTATVTAGPNGSATMAQTFIAGTYVGISACTKCHNGGLATTVVPTWSTTAHASVFTSVINGTAIAGYTESASCAPCHSVGFDPNNSVNDGGFTALMTQLNWSFPTTGQAGNWASMPSTLQNVANIQCENCHGPGSEHANYGGDTVAISVPTNTGACSQCHDEPSHHIKSAVTSFGEPKCLAKGADVRDEQLPRNELTPATLVGRVRRFGQESEVSEREVVPGIATHEVSAAGHREFAPGAPRSRSRRAVLRRAGGWPLRCSSVP